jgi:hypothetical protein
MFFYLLQKVPFLYVFIWNLDKAISYYDTVLVF